MRCEQGPTWWPGAPLPTPSASPGFGTPRAPSQAGARSPTLLGTAPISPNPQGFSGSPTAETKSSPGTFGLPGPGAYAPPPAQPVAVQPMGQPTAPSGSFGAAPSGSFGQTPTGGGFGQAPQPGSFGQPPAGGFGAPSPFGGGDGGDDDKARKKKMLIFGGIGCVVILILCCITAAVAVTKFRNAAMEAPEAGTAGNGIEGVAAEFARIPLTFVLTQLMAQCKTDPSGASIAPFFQPQVFDQLKAEGCAVDENVVTVFRDTQQTTVVNLATVPEGTLAKNLGIDPASCFLFDAGKGSRVVTCSDSSNATKIVHMEGIAQLRAQ